MFDGTILRDQTEITELMVLGDKQNKGSTGEDVSMETLGSLDTTTIAMSFLSPL